MIDFPKLYECAGFDWNEHNSEKIWGKHKVTPSECEQIFFNQPLIVLEDIDHSQREERFYALGRTDRGRRLYAVFTLRGKMIRVITARDMSRKERRVYDSYEE